MSLPVLPFFTFYGEDNGLHMSARFILSNNQNRGIPQPQSQWLTGHQKRRLGDPKIDKGMHVQMDLTRQKVL